MSEQRKIRQELRQGLHQFLMQLYISYRESHTDDEAKKVVIESIEEQYKYFVPEGFSNKQVKEVLSRKVSELTDKMNQEPNNYDMQLYYAEKIDSLNAAIEALDYN